MNSFADDLFSDLTSAEQAELARVDQRLQQTFANVYLLDPQDLVDVVAGQATANQRLRVAAYVRTDPRARQQMAALQQAWTEIQSETQSARRTAFTLRLPQFVATPLSAVAGLRSLAEPTWQHSFQVVELQAQVTVRIVPPSHERWQIEGYVTQNHLPLANAKVVLRSNATRPRPRQTDAAGFFAFRRLPAGEIDLRVYLEQGVILIEKIQLQE